MESCCCCCCTGAGQDVIRRRNLIDIVRSRLFAEQQLRPLELAECFVTSWAGQLMWPAASSSVQTRPGPAPDQLQYTVNTAITQVSNPSTGIFRWYLWDLQSWSHVSRYWLDIRYQTDIISTNKISLHLSTVESDFENVLNIISKLLK